MATKEWKDKNKDKMRLYRREHYYKNKEQYYDRNKKSNIKKKEFLDNIKDVPCSDCKIKYPSYVMDFDHLDPDIKVDHMARLSRNSWRKIKEEVVKCEVVCSNCHRIRTHNRK